MTAGDRHGMWVVIGEPRDGANPGLFVECMCDCGTIRSVYKYNLTGGRTNSCGCYRKSPAPSRRLGISASEYELRYRYRGYQKGAKSRGMQFLLSIDEFLLCSSGDCHYCGAEPVDVPSSQLRGRPMSGYFCNGIDRVNNEVGYIAGNVVPCCGQCNMAKGTSTKEKFIEMCKAVAAHNKDL